jgi:hypothetical protein
MAKGDVVQQDKSFMGMPVRHYISFSQAGQFQRAPSQQFADDHLNPIGRAFCVGQRCSGMVLPLLATGSQNWLFSWSRLRQLPQHVLIMMTGLRGRLLEYVSSAYPVPIDCECNWHRNGMGT